MKLTKVEQKKTVEGKLIKKKLGGKYFWIKPIDYKKYQDYKQGNVKSHLKYLKLLKKYLKNNTPKTTTKIDKINGREILLIISEHISGKTISKISNKDLSEEINQNLVNGMKLLLKKGYVLDFYGKNNFIKTKENKIYYVDTRMPLFSKKSNEGKRFDLSKKKTEELIK